MKKKVAGLALASVGAGLLWLIGQFVAWARLNQADAARQDASQRLGEAQAPGWVGKSQHPSIPRPHPFPSVKTQDPVIEITSRLGSPDAGIEDDIGILGVVLESYRRSLGSVPAGMNDQVVAALQGGNTRGLVVFPSTHAALSPKGELLDRWGTPYWFHAMSGMQMDVVSAGPDKQLGTADDVGPLGHKREGDIAHED